MLLASRFSMLISLIITTYNRPDALKRVLLALNQQTYQQFEVIIADDGSSAETAQLIESLKIQVTYAIQHSWQSDEGFRAAMARNRAAARANGDYLIFLDGDCVPFPDFVARHVQLAEQHYFVAGNRILLNPEFTQTVLNQALNIETWHFSQWLRTYWQGKINRILPLLRLPFHWGRKQHPHRWQGAKTCNLAVWRKDFLQINGFDETYQGWGHEDADLVVRLQRAHILRKEGRFAVPVLHLWHPEQNRNQEADNQRRLQHILNSQTTWAELGVQQYLKKIE